MHFVFSPEFAMEEFTAMIEQREESGSAVVVATEQNNTDEISQESPARQPPLATGSDKSIWVAEYRAPLGAFHYVVCNSYFQGCGPVGLGEYFCCLVQAGGYCILRRNC